jgi:hypothetical protein
MDQPNDLGERKTRESAADAEADVDTSPVEADPRFPSGRWQGYSLIPPERCPQSTDLLLTFRDGVLTGTGSDISSEFTVVGTYADDGRCSFEKRYPSGQAIRFDGYHVNQGRYVGISGDWVLDERWHERFWIEPVSEQMP